jgi:hypothetical protein
VNYHSPHFDDYVGDLLAGLISLRTFEIEFVKANRPIMNDLSFIQAPHLKYFAMDRRCYKMVGGGWVICCLPGLFHWDCDGERVFDRLDGTLCPG